MKIWWISCMTIQMMRSAQPQFEFSKFLLCIVILQILWVLYECFLQGMACQGRTKVCTIVPPNHFGEIPGVHVGQLWKFRVTVRKFDLWMEQVVKWSIEHSIKSLISSFLTFFIYLLLELFSFITSLSYTFVSSFFPVLLHLVKLTLFWSKLIFRYHFWSFTFSNICHHNYHSMHCMLYQISLSEVLEDITSFTTIPNLMLWVACILEIYKHPFCLILSIFSLLETLL